AGRYHETTTPTLHGRPRGWPENQDQRQHSRTAAREPHRLAPPGCLQGPRGGGMKTVSVTLAAIGAFIFYSGGIAPTRAPATGGVAPPDVHDSALPVLQSNTE